ncbi:hypothetical protein JW933_06825 [candidate division FCPU426 bacterium]|nr:hypothetical protein [candidate division FCPU426 bacterium]
MIKRLSPALSIALGVFLAALVLQLAVIKYLGSLSQQQLDEETKKLKTQIAEDLAAQLGTALAAKDDLGALMVIKSARSIYPQLYKAEVFRSDGTIFLHSDPGQMGQKTSPYPGPRPSSPEITRLHLNHRPLTVVLVPMPTDDDLFFRVFFDDIRVTQAGKAYTMRMYLFILAASLLLALYVVWRVNRFELLDPKERADLPPADALKRLDEKCRRMAELLLAEMRHAAVAINAHNCILAANDLALELLNCRAEELEGLHVMQAPLPSVIVAFYQTAIKNPERATEDRLVLAGKGPALPVKLICMPPSPRWELALLSLS